jgi:transposase
MEQEQQQQPIREVRYYSEAFKRQVIQEYLAGGITQAALQRKYDIRGKCSILMWRRNLGYCGEDTGGVCNLGTIKPIEVTQKKEVKSVNELQQRIKELERQLEDEKLRAEAYARIIDKAEKDLKIPLRKKPGTR